MLQLYLFDQAPPSPRYGGHEGYIPKKHWLKRAVEAALRDPQFWCQPTPLTWGLSVSQLKAAKHWAIAFKLLEPQGKQEKPDYYNVSEFAQRLLLDSGADPYLEDPQSQWLLHWNLLREPCYLKSWAWFFGKFYQPEFTAEYVLNQLCEHVEQQGDTVARSTLESDLNCLYRLYLPSLERYLEDQIVALFSDLILLSNDGDSKKELRLRKRTGTQKVGLSCEVLLYVCLEYIHHKYRDSGKERRVVALRELLYELGSPGLLFLVTQYQLEGVLDQLCRRFSWLHLSDCAGITQISLDKPIQECLQDVWDTIYQRNSLIQGGTPIPVAPWD